MKWLSENNDGYPRSWEQEALNEKVRGFSAYDDEYEAPPIAGYDILEANGVAIRLETVVRRGEERIHFRLRDGDSTP